LGNAVALGCENPKALGIDLPTEQTVLELKKSNVIPKFTNRGDMFTANLKFAEL
jgi:hypothetical protein